MSENKQQRPWHKKFSDWRQSNIVAGRQVRLVPHQVLHFPKMSMMSVRFPVAAKSVRQLLPQGKFELALRGSGTAELFLAAMQYREVDGMLAFNQFCIGTLVRPLTDDPVHERRGYFYLYSPVTTQQACRVGVKDYGFPTFLADIKFEETAVSYSCHLSADDTHILSLSLKKRETEPDMWSFTNLTNHNGEIRQSYFQAKGQGFASERASQVYCELGGHPLADRLRELRLGSSSLCHRFAPEAEALLHKARRVY